MNDARVGIEYLLSGLGGTGLCRFDDKAMLLSEPDELYPDRFHRQGDLNNNYLTCETLTCVAVLY